jgi:serine/threonine-protein kinase HipA
MDRDLHVYMDVGGEPIWVGRLWLRENGTATFRYELDWLQDPRAFALAPSLALGEGAFHTSDGNFGAFKDAAPDRWGQKLMRHRERNRARDANQPPRTLLPADFLLGVDDATRVGALRFKDSGGGAFLSQSNSPVPPLIELRKLLGATNRLERGRERKGDLELVLAPGGSLGGARPKATIRGDDGRLHVAKFPWVNDDWPVIRWEATTLSLARSAGISVPEWRLVPVQGNAVLLLARFDRDGENKRIPSMSAMTALDAKDHEDHSYLELVDALRQIGDAPDADAQQLWRRMAFNVLVSNTDDHLRNHAFLRGRSGWRLSPAFDMNPCPLDIGSMHVLALNEFDHTGSLDIALSTSDYFGLKFSDAKHIAGEVGASVSTWKATAEKMGIKKHEIERMASAFLEDDIKTASSYSVAVAVAAPAQERPVKKKQNKGRTRSSSRARP